MAGRSRRKRVDGFVSADSPELLNPILDGIDASRETRYLSKVIAESIEETMWVVGMPRTTVAATAVYIASQAAGDGVTQSAIADHSDTSIGSISKRKKPLLTEYLEISDESADEPLQNLDPVDL